MTYEYIDKPEGLNRAVASLGSCLVIALDTEGDSLHHYQERLCLIQMTGNDQSWIVDPLTLHDPSPLASLFKDDRILKVLHGADYDLVCLKRDFGFEVHPIFDTAIAARALGATRFSLGDLLSRYVGVTLDKRYQKADWSRRPLPKEWLDYAADDTRYLPRLYELLKKELEAAGRLEMVEEESQQLTLREWTGKRFEPDDYLRMKGVQQLSPEGQRVARALTVARDQEARRLDHPPFKVLSGQDIVRVAHTPPKTLADFVHLFPRSSHSVRRHGDFWLAVVAKGLADQSALPRRQTKREPLSRAQRHLLARLQAWRNEQAKAEGVEPAMVLSMQELTGVVLCCSSPPSGTVEAIHRLPFLRNWQKKRYGVALARLLSL